MNQERTKFINIRLKAPLLKELNLPDIDYPIPLEVLSEPLEDDNLPFALMLFGLQNVENASDKIIMAKNRLAQIISPDDNRDIITACGENWWLELGPINMNKEMVTIQQRNNLIGVIQSREDGRLRVATYRMLDIKSLSILIRASSNPHPQHGVCMRDNNWEYIKDNSALISNAYADMRGESYLSYWEFGLGISQDKNIIESWYSQRKLTPIKPQIVVTELGVFYIYSDTLDQ